MYIQLYKCSCESNRIDKSAYLSELVTINGTLKQATSLINPKITIELSLFQTLDVVDDDGYELIDDDGNDISYDLAIAKYNYCHIPEFNRYYFIDDITSITNRLWELTMHCDVLMSFKDNILNLNAFVLRNENDFNDYIEDKNSIVQVANNVSFIEFEDGAKVDTKFSYGLYGNPSILICTIGSFWQDDSAMSYSNDFDRPSLALHIPDVVGDDTGFGTFKNACCIQASNLEYIANHLDETKRSYIDNIIAYPMVLKYDDSKYEQLYVDHGSLALGRKGYSLNTRTSAYYTIADFTLNSSDWTDYEPYSVYEMWIPYHQFVKFSASDILNKRIIVTYTINYETGDSYVYVVDDTNQKIIYSSTCQLGVKIGITTNNTIEIQSARNSNNLNTILGVIANTGMLVSGNVQGALGLASTIGNGVFKNDTLYNKASSTCGSGIDGLFLPQNVFIKKTSSDITLYDDADYSAQFGRPLNDFRTLSTLTGFTQIGDVHLDGFEDALSGEISQIDTLLKSGIIL